MGGMIKTYKMKQCGWCKRAYLGVDFFTYRVNGFCTADCENREFWLNIHSSIL